MRRLTLALLAVAAVHLSGNPARAASKTDIQIVPGAVAMSEEERAILPNPAVGEEHSVVLLEEMERDEKLGTQGRTTFHLRAKILSNAGRELADVELPYQVGRQTLAKWWGRTILPDGTVHELKQDQLEEQSLTQVGDEEMRAIKAALPGVVAGAVIDYGYEMVHHESFLAFDRIVLQRRQPVRQLRYRWRPSQFLGSAGYLVSRAEGLDLHVTRDKESVLVEGHNLPAVPDEAYMPPEYDVRASVLFHYMDRNEGGTDFWKVKAKAIETDLRFFCGRKEELVQAVTAMNVDPSAAAGDRVEAAYRWIVGHVTGDEQAANKRRGASGLPERASAAGVILARHGSDDEINTLFACVARLFGGEAWVARVTDRRMRLFNPEWPSARQFAGTIVVVQEAGGGGGLVMVDPSSGLPFGQVPWRFSGGPALLATAEGGRIFQVPAGRAADNTSHADVDLSFADGNQSVRRRWTLTGTGQVALERGALRRLTPGARARWVENRCRGSAEEDVLRSEIQGLDGGAAEPRLECETELPDTQLDASIGRYSTYWVGPWLEPPPELPPGPRFHPVVFHYPRADLARVVVHAPHGFAAAEALPDVSLAGRYGKYELHVSRGEEGYTVERGFALLPLAVPAAEYEALRGFLDDVTRADRTVLEFRRVAASD